MIAINREFVGTLKSRMAAQSPLIQVVLGPRQVGKTTGVLQFLKSKSHRYHYASADDLIGGHNAWIYEQWQLAEALGDSAILALDEVQKLPQWSESIKKLWDQQQRLGKKIKLILLGSSSLDIQKGLSESLTGRFETIRVFHWNFCESKDSVKMDLETYLKFGGYPKSYEFLKDADRWKNYIKTSIIETVIGKDILSLVQVRNPALFRQCFEILCSYPAQEMSYRKLLGQLQDKGNTDLIKFYIELYQGAFLFKTLEKYSKKPLKIKSSSPKILPMCPALASLFSPQTGDDLLSRVFECSVGVSLTEAVDQVYYWREGNVEVDYVALLDKRLIAIEVKFGRIKHTKGLDKFVSQFKNARPVIITIENYERFIKDPKEFLRSMF